MSSPLAQIEVPPPVSFITESRSAALLQHLREKPQLARVSPASRLEIRPAPDTGSSGIPQVDALTGGFPRGCLTEVSGPDSSGRTSLMLSVLAAATRREEICTLIDVSDAFDPHSAVAAGVNPERLLWVRCGAHAQSSALSRKRRPAASLQEWERLRMEDPVEQALRATDLTPAKQRVRAGRHRSGKCASENSAPYSAHHLVPFSPGRGKYSNHIVRDRHAALRAILRLAVVAAEKPSVPSLQPP